MRSANFSGQADALVRRNVSRDQQRTYLLNIVGNVLLNQMRVRWRATCQKGNDNKITSLRIATAHIGPGSKSRPRSVLDALFAQKPVADRLNFIVGSEIKQL